MADRSDASISIDTTKAIEWIEQLSEEVPNISRYVDASSIAVKDMVFLALLELGDSRSTYQQITQVLEAREVLHIVDSEKKAHLPSLRNAVSQIKVMLKNDPLFQFEQTQSGKQSLFSLSKSKNKGPAVEITDEAENFNSDVVEILRPDPTTSMHSVAEKFIQDRKMPFYGIYLPLRGAARWVRYSEEQEDVSEEKKSYEGNQCEELLKGWFVRQKGSVITILGLGVGEGVGEIEIIERLLTNEKYQFESIHYCAIDTNVFLLMDHATRLRNRFKKYLRSKKLVCSVVRGNFLENFSELIDTARDTVRKQTNNRISEFMPEESGKLISVLGNVIGNLEHRASEWNYFKPILEKFNRQDVVFLMGVGIQHTNGKGEIITEDYGKDDLFLSTLQYLTYELKILNVHHKDKNFREFYFNSDNFELTQSTYQGDGLISGTHIQGDIYEFIYTMQGELSMDELSVPSGTKFLLYNIIKFNRETFVEFLKMRNLFVNDNGVSMMLNKDGIEKERRAYAVLAAGTREL